MSEDEIVARIARLSPDAVRVYEVSVQTQELVAAVNAANTGALRCRELSLALTNIEQGGLWLSALLARLDTA